MKKDKKRDNLRKSLLVKAYQLIGEFWLGGGEKGADISFLKYE